MRTTVIGLACAFGLAACATPAPAPFGVAAVPAALETAPMTGRGDRADDPAIWIHPDDPARSLILGTNKQEGLYVYDLAGAETQRLPIGPLNNVDLRGSLAVASNDGLGALSWFRVDAETGLVRHLGDTPTNDPEEPYGVCLGAAGGDTLAIVTYRSGAAQVWRVEDPAAASVTAAPTRRVQLGSQLEGCVIDDANGRAFIGEEAVGVWSLDLTRADAAPVAVDTVAAGNGLAADVEGLTLWLGAEPDEGYLVASAQGASRFVVYDRAAPHAVRGAFTIAAAGDVDAVSVTDGVDVTSAAVPGFPAGFLVAQDDANPRPEVDQNFKIVDWRAIAAALGL